MFSISKISNFAGVVILIFSVKMFFFSAFFIVTDAENIPQNIYEYSHVQYSSAEKIKRIREINFEEWLETNVHSVVSDRSIPQKLLFFFHDFQSDHHFLSLNCIENATDLAQFTSNKDCISLLNKRTYLRFQKLIL